MLKVEYLYSKVSTIRIFLDWPPTTVDTLKVFYSIINKIKTTSITKKLKKKYEEEQEQVQQQKTVNKWTTNKTNFILIIINRHAMFLLSMLKRKTSERVREREREKEKRKNYVYFYTD